ncbi:MAG: hypothetical protein GY951_03835 [Psychromonas sp.]|nr:hypothetical protein [Alteromonadales bacterium]MCP5077171.1 hypothetical protein [Psychromonas sp.]
MLNPDFNDPNWLQQRQRLWEERKPSLLDCTSKKERVWLKTLFFDPEFDYGNVEKYGKYAENYFYAFGFSPVQHPQKWQKWFAEDLPKWLGEQYTLDPSRIMWELAFTLHNPGEHWDDDVYIELFRFCYGDKITTAPYQFLQFDLPRHPFLLGSGSRLITFYKNWLGKVVYWLEGGFADDQHFAVELFPMWLSTLQWINPLCFQHALKDATREEQRDLQQLFIFCRDQANYDLQYQSSLLEQYAKKDTLKNDTGKRLAFLGHFKQQFEAFDKPAELEALWQQSQQSDFISAWQGDRIEDADYRKPNKTVMRRWTRDKIAAIFDHK